MKITEQKNDVVIIGEDTSKKAKISENKLSKLQYLLTKGLYKDPITAVIAEWTNNGIDSVVQAGKDPIQNPVIVSIERNLQGQYSFRVEDKGTGLDDRDFEDICMNYLESTKEEDDDTIGHFGIGMKSFLALERPATFTCRKNGIERKYLVYEGAEFVNYDLVSKQPTTEENGVIAELSIKDWTERCSFVTKAEKKLTYYDTAVLVIDKQPKVHAIYRNELFQWSDTKYGEMHLSLKDVYYPIDWEALDLKPINIPIAIRLGLKDGMKPTPSRESYISTEATKNLIKDKIAEIANWFVDRYNETVKDAKTFAEAYPYIDTTDHYVKVQNTTFKINELEKYGKAIRQINIEGIKLMTPSWYKNKSEELVAEYDIVAVNSRGQYKTKKFHSYLKREVFIDQSKIILVDFAPFGNVKEFLKEKYPGDTGNIIFVKKVRTTRLGKSKDNDELYDKSYKYILGLTIKKKELWRPFIQEWQSVVKTVTDTFIDERNVHNTQEYLDWLEQKRERQREERKLKAANRDSTYVGLNKQKGDITISYAVEKKYGGFSFKKQVFPISSLRNNKYLTVICEPEEKETALQIADLIRKNIHVRFAQVGKLEAKKIPNHYQFIKLKDFMVGSKTFKRMASALLFQEVVEEFDRLSRRKPEIIKYCLKKVADHRTALREYIDSNIQDTSNDNADAAILEIARKNDLFDKSLWDIYTEFKKEVDKFHFITYLEVPKVWTPTTTERFNKMINEYLLFRKRHFNDIEGVEIVLKEVEPVNEKESETKDSWDEDEENFGVEEEELELV